MYRRLIPIVILVLSLLLVGSVFSQTAVIPDQGIKSNKTYLLSDIETIALQSGNLMFQVPLGGVPAGRGGATAGISLFYNSKIWNGDLVHVDEAPYGGYDSTALHPSPEGNWRYGYKYSLTWDPIVADSQTNPPLGLCRNVFLTPDGTRHPIYVADAEIDVQGASTISATGVNCNSHTAPPGGQTIRSFSVDSTFVKVEFYTDGDSDTSNDHWIAFFPDGSRVENHPASGIEQRIYDRNNNFVDIIEKIADTEFSNHRTVRLADVFGRSSVLEYGTGTGGVDQDTVHSIGFNGATLQTTIRWKNIQVNHTYQKVFWTLSTLDETLRVVDTIHLPSASTYDPYYEFTYNADNTSATDNGWGEVDSVRLPSGATAAYEYTEDGTNGIGAEEVMANRVSQKQLTYSLEYDGSSSNTSETWTYAGHHTGSLPFWSSVTSPDGATVTEYYSRPLTEFGMALSPENVKTVSSDGGMTERYYATNSPGWRVSGITPIGAANRYLKYEYKTVADSSGTPQKTAITEYTRDKNGNVTEAKEYDFVAYSSIPRNSDGFADGLPAGIAGSIKRITKTEYYNATPEASSTNYTDADSYHAATSPRLLNLVKSVEIQDASSTPKSRVEMTYDYTDYASSNTVAGNVTGTKSWDSFKGGTSRSYSNPLTSTNSITTSASYNGYGMPVSTSDANGIVTQITYGNIAGPSGNVTDLYPTQTITAYGTGVARTSSAVYDFYTGLVTSATDVDNNITNATEYDNLGRPVKAISALGTSLEAWTTTEYHDAERFVVVKSDLEAKGDGKKQATQFFDQLGRVRLSKTLEDPSQSATNETDGIKVQTRYETVSGYTYQLKSNPYRASVSTGASGEPTMGWTRSKGWAAGHQSQVETFSGSALPAPWGSNTSSTGIVSTVTDSDTVTVTDQAGKVRRSVTNALGQLIRVDEPNGAGQLGDASSPTQATYYTYDTLNNLTTVNQGVQTRTFAYNSLSRLVSAQNPESGTINYVYDANGNLTSKVDARTITTAYTYDALNRVLTRAYTGETGYTTPNVSYLYDNLPNAKGRLTKVSSAVSTTEYTSFDILGRVLAAKQTTEGGDAAGYSTSYTYNLSGALIEETYPSGRKVKNVLDDNGDLSMVQSARCGVVNGVTATCSDPQGYFSYAKSFTYNASGAVTSMQLGNGRWESTTFNSRLQPTQIALGTVQNATDKLKLDYTYNTTGNADNNGNVLSQKITVARSGQTDMVFDQTYTYDSLNRLKMAEEKTGTTTNWKQTFVFDRYGNRNFDRANTTQPASFANPNVTDPSVDAANNRFTSGQGYTYDAAGNVITDAEGRTFTYDGENKQIEVRNSGSSTIGQYYFDGDGKRVKKYVPSTGETTVFVYDASGKLVAEYSTNVVPVQDAKVSYLTADHLGSPRITTDALGQVISRHDYHPFGEEIFTAQRTTGLNYSADSVRKQFTGYERDTETDLDFAQARMYSNKLGRFTTVDPIAMTEDRPLNPQTINLYIYSANRPLFFIDPSGEKVIPSDPDSQKKWDDYKKWVEDGYLAGKKGFAELRATIKTLEESNVVYNLSVTSTTPLGDSVSGSVDIASNGASININVVLSGGTNQDFSQNSIFAHELEHARQFNDGEWGFVLEPDKEGDVTVGGTKYKARKIGYDIGDEVKAFRAMITAANGFDMSVRFPRLSSEEPLLTQLAGVNDKKAEKVLARTTDEYKDMTKVTKGGFGNGTIKAGTSIRPSDGDSNGRRAFGCFGGGCKW